jgi:5,6-dimethylbenzimidazole synthase
MNSNETETETNNTPGVFMDLVKRRTSHRGGYLKDEVSEAQIQYILEAARWAPSAGNSQPWEFVVVRDPELRESIIQLSKKQMADKLEMEFTARRTRKVGSSIAFRHAPVFIVILGDPRLLEAFPVRTRLDKGQSHYYSSLSNCVLTLVLAATSLGLGTQWLSDVASPYFATLLKGMLGIPDPLYPYHLIPIGYVDRQLRPNPRRELDQQVHYDRYDPAKFRTDEQIKGMLAEMGIRSPNYRW